LQILKTIEFTDRKDGNDDAKAGFNHFSQLFVRQYCGLFQALTNVALLLAHFPNRSALRCVRSVWFG
jgi:hypothetical protein